MRLLSRFGLQVSRMLNPRRGHGNPPSSATDTNTTRSADAEHRPMSLVLIDGVAVEVDGEGDAVVLVHGLGGTSNNWTPVMGALARHRSIRPDLPGSGRSARVEGALSIERYVECVKAVCDRLDVKRAHFVGHSLGTIVCFHLAARFPALVRSLALFGPLLAPPEAARPNIAARGAKARNEGVAGMQA